MKGHRNVMMIQGHVVGPAERRVTPNGKEVANFTVGVGGNRQKSIPGAFIDCLGWEDDAEIVEKAVHFKGQAVTVYGRFSQKSREVNGRTFINNTLHIDQLFVQETDTATEVNEVALTPRKGGDASEAKAKAAK